jgi:hypothetical protein
LASKRTGTEVTAGLFESLETCSKGQAYSKLNEGDHYIAVILEKSLGPKLRKGWFS